MSKTVKSILIIIILLVVIFLFIYPKLEFGSENAASGPAQGPPAMAMGGGSGGALPVEAVVMKPTAMENKIRVTGSVQANESLEIRSEISGIVRRINFREGQSVRKGDLLLTINDDDLQAQLEKLQYNRKLFQDNEYRQRALLEREAISREEYERALTELKTSEADIRLVEVQIAKTQIRAPFDGVVGLRNISEGAYITPNNVVANMYSINPAKIEFSVPARYSGQLNAGDVVYFNVDGVTGIVEGKIYAIEPQIDPTTRTLRLRAEAPNADRKLLPGQFARIEVVLEKLEDTFMVPSIAITPEANRQLVFLVKNGKVEPRAIETGVRTEDMVQALSGVTAGDTVMVTGILQARPGMAVKVSRIRE